MQGYPVYLPCFTERESEVQAVGGATPSLTATEQWGDLRGPAVYLPQRPPWTPTLSHEVHMLLPWCLPPGDIT